MVRSSHSSEEEFSFSQSRQALQCFITRSLSRFRARTTTQQPFLRVYDLIFAHLRVTCFLRRRRWLDQVRERTEMMVERPKARTHVCEFFRVSDLFSFMDLCGERSRIFLDILFLWSRVYVGEHVDWSFVEKVDSFIRTLGSSYLIWFTCCMLCANL